MVHFYLVQIDYWVRNKKVTYLSDKEMLFIFRNLKISSHIDQNSTRIFAEILNTGFKIAY